MLTLFFSYSHHDQKLRDQLEVHLAMLKREGTISTWHDGRIDVGKDLDKAVKEQLEAADIVLLLVSPHFIASDYCYNIEMQRAMERHDAGTARVIPVILEPCDWHSAPFGRLRATPADGKPITKFTNLNDGFLNVVQDIRRAAEELQRKEPAKQSSQPAVTAPAMGQVPVANRQGPRSSNLRIKKAFSEKEKDDFLDDAYEYISRFFENSLAELQERNPGTETRFKRIDATHFDASVYRDGKRESNCRIWRTSGRSLGSGIFYSSAPSAGDNSYNESLDTRDDGYALSLRAQMGIFHGGREKANMAPEGAAEHLWEMLVQGLR
jgi:hypothetical protein